MVNKNLPKVEILVKNGDNKNGIIKNGDKWEFPILKESESLAQNPGLVQKRLIQFLDWSDFTNLK